MLPERTMTATEFKAKCLRILDQLAQRKLGRVCVSKRGRLVAIVTPPEPETNVDRLFGCMRGTVVVPRGAKLVGPVLDQRLHAAAGRIHE
jgi:hypothetical protein